MMLRLCLSLAVAVSVAGCGGQHEDLKASMQEQGKGVKGKLDPLPHAIGIEGPIGWSQFAKFRRQIVPALRPDEASLAAHLVRRRSWL